MRGVPLHAGAPLTCATTEPAGTPPAKHRCVRWLLAREQNQPDQWRGAKQPSALGFHTVCSRSNGYYRSQSVGVKPHVHDRLAVRGRRKAAGRTARSCQCSAASRCIGRRPVRHSRVAKAGHGVPDEQRREQIGSDTNPPLFRETQAAAGARSACLVIHKTGFSVGLAAPSAAH